jgi:DNA (cytosine-5)-methyltransferase 1
MTNNKHKFPYKWNLADGYPAKGIAKNECNVFGTFICGGGSTMGYKLAGFNHLGGVEIDVKVADVYKENHKPKYLFVEDIRAFNKRTDLPTELYNLDILDGSPPCSTFSMAGSREKAWGKSKQFREGQAMQTLDDLVFVYCDTIIKLQPKVFLLENVKGIIQGNAKAYSKAIVKKMQEAGYTVQVFCLNAASMGVPQKRERVFFIGHKKEFLLPKLELAFNEEAILFSEIIEKNNVSDLTERQLYLWKNRIKSDKSNGDTVMRLESRLSGFTNPILHSDEVCPTINSQGGSFMLYELPRQINDKECCLCGSYPIDYNFKGLHARYLIGMSVPPVMTAQISHQIYLQWLSKIKQ